MLDSLGVSKMLGGFSSGSKVMVSVLLASCTSGSPVFNCNAHMASLSPWSCRAVAPLQSVLHTTGAVLAQLGTNKRLFAA